MANVYILYINMQRVVAEYLNINVVPICQRASDGAILYSTHTYRHNIRMEWCDGTVLQPSTLILSIICIYIRRTHI